MKSACPRLLPPAKTVAPYAGAWIEIVDMMNGTIEVKVAPYAGAWIEMQRIGLPRKKIRWSLPTRERGLKYDRIILFDGICPVAPYAGAWIEIPSPLPVSSHSSVAPYAGAWIEISER